MFSCMTRRLDLRNNSYTSCRAGRLDVIEVIAGVRLVRMLVQPLHSRIIGPQSEAGIERHLFLVSVVGVVVEVVGEVEVEDVFFPVGLPGAELDDELGRVVVAAAVELAMSVFDVASLRCDLWNQSYHDTSRSPTRSIDAISSWDGAIVQSSLLQN
jgi:hypothetical protein